MTPRLEHYLRETFIETFTLDLTLKKLLDCCLEAHLINNATYESFSTEDDSAAVLCSSSCIAKWESVESSVLCRCSLNEEKGVLSLSDESEDGESSRYVSSMRRKLVLSLCDDSGDGESSRKRFRLLFFLW